MKTISLKITGMKKYFILGTLLTALMFIFAPVNAYSEPKIMSDGQVFDPVFYAAQNPDVVKALGTDEAALYKHYTMFGQKEGRLPFNPAQSTPAASTPATADKIVKDINGGAQKMAEVQKAYTDLPQNVKNYYNKRNVNIYTCVREHIALISSDGKPHNGLCAGKRTRNHETWQWVDHNYDLYIAGSVNSFQSPRYVLYHELGHILDFELATQRGQWYYSDNWAGWTEMIPYSKTQVYNCNEAFAEAFAGYFEQPEKLKRIAPNAYVYIENFIVNMK